MRPQTHAYFLEKSPESIEISKLEAAERQLETAIRLWFEGGDEVSVATLSHAAWQIIRSINKKYGAKGNIGDPIPGVDSKTLRKAESDLFSGAANYFKHCGSMEFESIHYRPWATLLILCDAVRVYQQWPLSRKPVFDAFLIWMSFCLAKAFPDDDFKESNRVLGLKLANRRSRLVFFRFYLAACGAGAAARVARARLKKLFGHTFGSPNSSTT